MHGSSGWGDAVVLVPWDLLRWYGDEQVLAELWPNMVRWVDWVAEQARTRRHPSRTGVPAPHEAFLWDAGWHWGEWCEPEGVAGPFYEIDQGHVGTAYLHHTAGLLAEIGRRLGQDVDRFDELSVNARDAWRAEYVGDDGRLTPDTQANHVRALALGLTPTPEATTLRLVELIHEADDHLATGFLSTRDLLPVLADHAQLDLAYALLLQDTAPSWLAMVHAGATTVWESWAGSGCRPDRAAA
jgi:alpha-L-rhamnosidase